MARQSNAASLVEVEKNAANALLNLLQSARTAGDALTVRAATSALASLSNIYSRFSTDDEQNRMPTCDVAALQQAIDDHYAFAAFIASNPALAERQGIALSRWGDTFDTEVDKIRYWRSPEQQAIDKQRHEEYQREREAKKAAAASDTSTSN